jgi:hypothetical protein
MPSHPVVADRAWSCPVVLNYFFFYTDAFGSIKNGFFSLDTVAPLRFALPNLICA